MTQISLLYKQNLHIVPLKLNKLKKKKKSIKEHKKRKRKGDLATSGVAFEHPRLGLWVGCEATL
jgi:hypothetical protein